MGAVVNGNFTGDSIFTTFDQNRFADAYLRVGADFGLFVFGLSGQYGEEQNTNWKDLGGPDAKIIVYSRENSSGTYVFFKETVLGGADFTPRAQTMPGTAAVVNAVAKEKFGIGYGGAAYAQGIKILKVKGASGPAIAPDKSTVMIK